MKIFSMALWITLAGILTAAFAQTDRGTIEGVITDASAAAIPGAQVQIVQIETNTTISITTNEQGRYFA
ncbi:MAG: carboxypeptidase regulatory-like domain-containing protein, partial [Gammaproteobacteria bacterium]